MIGNTPAQEWMRSRPPLPPLPPLRKRRNTHRAVWAFMGFAAVIEILIGVFVP